MTFTEEVAQLALNSAHANIGAIFGSAQRLSPGAGVLYSGVTFPIFNYNTGRYEARVGTILVLTHECDVEQQNDRDFNTEFIFLPLMTMSAYAARFDTDDVRRSYGKQLAANIAAGRVTRVHFLPPTNGGFELGAFLLLNSISSTHVSELGKPGVVANCALSEYGLSLLDNALNNHLFRPKAEQLPRL